MDVSDVGVCQLIRLGAHKTGQGDQPRPVKVRLNKEEHHQAVLKSAKNLQNVVRGGWSKVFIQPDLTPKQNGKKTTCNRAERTAASRRVKPDHSEQQDYSMKKCSNKCGKCRPHATTATDGPTVASGVSSSRRQLKCFYTNASSLIGKFDEFKYRASKCDIC